MMNILWEFNNNPFVTLGYFSEHQINANHHITSMAAVIEDNHWMGMSYLVKLLVYWPEKDSHRESALALSLMRMRFFLRIALSRYTNCPCATLKLKPDFSSPTSALTSTCRKCGDARWWSFGYTNGCHFRTCNKNLVKPNTIRMKLRNPRWNSAVVELPQGCYYSTSIQHAFISLDLFISMKIFWKILV